jgi:hypothetical protein
VLAKPLGRMDGRMPVATRRLDTLANLEVGQLTTRRLAGREKGWTQDTLTYQRTCKYTVHTTNTAAPTSVGLQEEKGSTNVCRGVRSDHIMHLYNQNIEFCFVFEHAQLI